MGAGGAQAAASGHHPAERLHVPRSRTRKTWRQQPRMLQLQEAFLLTPAGTPSHPQECWLRSLSKVKFGFST